jgi:hypothetical protein
LAPGSFDKDSHMGQLAAIDTYAKSSAFEVVEASMVVRRNRPIAFLVGGRSLIAQYLEEAPAAEATSPSL